MQGELYYGTSTFGLRNDGDAFGEPGLSAKGLEESAELKCHEETPHLDIYNSTRRLDKYLYYFSSKL